MNKNELTSSLSGYGFPQSDRGSERRTMSERGTASECGTEASLASAKARGIDDVPGRNLRQILGLETDAETTRFKRPRTQSRARHSCLSMRRTTAQMPSSCAENACISWACSACSKRRSIRSIKFRISITTIDAMIEIHDGGTLAPPRLEPVTLPSHHRHVSHRYREADHLRT